MLCFFDKIDDTEIAMNRKNRSFDFEGKRIGLMLTAETWAALDLIAQRDGIRWQDFASSALMFADEGATHADAIRDAVMARLSEIIAPSGTPDSDEAINHPFVRSLRVLTSENFQPIRDDFREVWAVDCGVYTLRVGYNLNAPDGEDPMLLVDSRLVDGLSVQFGGTGD